MDISKEIKYLDNASAESGLSEEDRIVSRKSVSLLKCVVLGGVFLSMLAVIIYLLMRSPTATEIIVYRNYTQPKSMGRQGQPWKNPFYIHNRMGKIIMKKTHHNLFNKIFAIDYLDKQYPVADAIKKCRENKPEGMKMANITQYYNLNIGWKLHKILKPTKPVFLIQDNVYQNDRLFLKTIKQQYYQMSQQKRVVLEDLLSEKSKDYLFENLPDYLCLILHGDKYQFSDTCIEKLAFVCLYEKSLTRKY